MTQNKSQIKNEFKGIYLRVKCNWSKAYQHACAKKAQNQNLILLKAS